MKKQSIHLISVLTVVLGVGGLIGVASAAVQQIPLKNSQLNVVVTPDIGGRLLSINLVDQPNFLRVGEPVVSAPNPKVSADSDNVGYLAHEIWVGPQSQWWLQQTVNAKRSAQKADWPPDPYLILAKNKILKMDAQHIQIESPASPVTGVQVTKDYQLSESDPNNLLLRVYAKNIRQSPVAWDIWFNTRAFSSTHIYVPVADEQHVRVKNLSDEKFDELSPVYVDGFFSLDMTKPASEKVGRKGKVKIQPSQGWMAGFYGNQVLIIQFPLQQESVIHPEQGQIELYSELISNRLDEGLLEMEVHAPYKHLAPHESMTAEETWTLLEYKGEMTAKAHIAFLKAQVERLHLAK